jgi:hypothetical protein
MMRGRGIIGVIVLVWLLIGVYSVWNKGFFDTGAKNCASAATIALTVVAGPLNFSDNLSPHVTECPQTK